MKELILKFLEEIQNGYTLCGVVDRRARVYPLGSDTKVISTLFEIVVRQAVASYAKHSGLTLVEPTKQNHYPDFTLMEGERDRQKIAIDVKTTYKKEGIRRFSYTLGSYTSYIRPETASKNIVFPYDQYAEHWVIGFVYKRFEGKRDTTGRIYSFDTLNDIPIPFNDVEVFMQEKWRIAGDRAGSGNTANIGSITGTIGDFRSGNGVFDTEQEFLEYWRGYERTAPSANCLIPVSVNFIRIGMEQDPAVEVRHRSCQQNFGQAASTQSLIDSDGSCRSRAQGFLSRARC